MKYNHNALYKKVFLWQMMLSLTFLWWDLSALRLRPSGSSYAPMAIWEISWRYDLCDQVAICLRSERIATDLCARESTDGDFGDHGDQLETNQRSISAFEDLYMALSQSVAERRLVERGYYAPIPLDGDLWRFARSDEAPQIALVWGDLGVPPIQLWSISAPIAP